MRGDGTPANIRVSVTSTPTDDELFDIMPSDSATRVTIIRPDGVQITPIDGISSSGLTFYVYTAPDDALDDSLSTLLIPGKHIVVQFSNGALGGVYTIRATGTGSDSGLKVLYIGSAQLTAAAVTDAGAYRQGETAIISALVFNGTNPIANASVRAIVAGLTPVSGTMGRYQLTSQVQVSSTRTKYTYTAQLTPAANASSVIARASSTSAQATLADDTISFGEVTAGTPVTSQTSFTVEAPSAEGFDPTTLKWTISSVLAPTNLSLLDSGAYDVASGDGIYTGTFTASTFGDYTVFVTASVGTDTNDLTATTTFHVTPTRATDVGK